MGSAAPCRTGCAIAAEYTDGLGHGGECDARPEAARIRALQALLDAGVDGAELYERTETQARASWEPAGGR